MKENPNKTLVLKAFQIYEAQIFIDLSKKTGIHYMTLSRMFNNESHRIVSRAFKLVLDVIPPKELFSFLHELYYSYYPSSNMEAPKQSQDL